MHTCSHGDEIQHVLINEIDLLNRKHSTDTTRQLVHALVASPVVSLSRNSPQVASCFGPYINSKVSDRLTVKSTAAVNVSTPTQGTKIWLVTECLSLTVQHLVSLLSTGKQLCSYKITLVLALI